MFFVNTRNANDVVNFTQAVLKPMNGMRNGLYVPSYIPTLDGEKMVNLSTLSYKDILFEVIKIFCNNEISDADIKQLINQAFAKFGRKNNSTENISFDFKDEMFDVINFDKQKYIVSATYGSSGCIDDFGYYLCAEFIDYLSAKSGEIATIIDLSLNKSSYISTAIAVSGKKHLKSFVLMDEDVDATSMELLSANYGDNVVFATLDADEERNNDLQNLLYLNSSLQEQMNVSFIDGVNILNILAYIPFFIKIFHQAKLQQFVLVLPAYNASFAVSAYLASLLGCKMAKIVLCCEKNYFLQNFQLLKTINFNTVPNKNITDFTCEYPINFERILYYLCRSDQISVFNKLEECLMEKTAKVSDAIVIDFCNLFQVETCDNDFLIKKEMHNFLKKSGRFCDQNLALSLIATDNALKLYSNLSVKCNTYIFECIDYRRNINFIENAVGFKIQNVEKMCEVKNDKKIDTIKIGEYNEHFIFQLIIKSLNKENSNSTQK